MAEFSKYGAYSVGRLLLHNNRMENDGVQHSNESIDSERTYQNYHFKKGTVTDVQQRLSEIFVLSKNTNTVVLGEMIVTLPKDVKREDERSFFQAVYDFYCEDFGEENIINAVVHKDEKQPHIHIDFVPVLKGEPQYVKAHNQNAIEEWKKAHNGKPPYERLCCKELVTRKYLYNMHPRLSEYIREAIGYETEIINGATEGGNRTVLELKSNTLKKEIERMEIQKKHLGGEVNSMLTIAKSHGISEADIGLYPLLQKIEDLENQNKILKSIITRQGYSWKKEDMEAIKEKKFISAKSVTVNVCDGSLVNADIENNAVVVIELPDQVPRDLPQNKLIEADVDLERQAKFVLQSDKAVMSRASRTSDKIYLFIKTDSVSQTLENLLLLEQQLRELNERGDLKGRRIYMDKMETDKYDLARSILIQNQYEALYFANREVVAKNKTTEQNLTKEL